MAGARGLSRSAMSDPFDLGVLYTDHTSLVQGTPFASLWSYRNAVCGHETSEPPTLHGRLPSGRREYVLHRSDPLLNTILPGTHVSIVVNAGDRWATGCSLPAAAFVPPVAVFGPFTRPQLLRVGPHVRALGVVLPSILTRALLGAPVAELVNQIVPLEALWPRDQVERLCHKIARAPLAEGLVALRTELLRRLGPAARAATIEDAAVRLLIAHNGRESIERISADCGLSRQRFARRFRDATGLPPKVFARIVRFQALVYSLLSTNVAEWAGVAPANGFYDQAHMINEFRRFAGAPPIRFFRPHDDTVDPARINVRGRPSEWLRPVA
jgi:AraC-like DNA-binding protein